MNDSTVTGDGVAVSVNGHSSPFHDWLLEGKVSKPGGPMESDGKHHQQLWWKVMCLTGVDYFSTLGYQPGIAFLAAGSLSPIATFVLVLLTLFGALPVYGRVAEQSPHGEGSIAMLEHLLPWWGSKLFVLCLLGFAATDFIITITLSAADAAAHVIENPFVPQFMRHPVVVTLVLVLMLGAVFLKGFKEAIGLAVVLVAIYLGMNAVVMVEGIRQVMLHPHLLPEWKTALFTSHGSVFGMIGISCLLFPKLALGLSGFETGVAVMPLVKGDPQDNLMSPVGRIQNTRKLLITAAVIMSVFLIISALVTTLLIPAAEYMPATATHPAGAANGRALAYMAHRYLGNGFGTAYDLSTVCILWFAAASAMAGLLNLVPRYLPRYGMAPDWARAPRPLVLVYTVISVVVTLIFRADVDAQGGAYATGVLVLMTSAAIAVALSVKRTRGRWPAFALIATVFMYTTAVNMVERPEGIKIAGLFIGGIMAVSFASRLRRTTELRVERVEMDEAATRFIEEARSDAVRLIPNHSAMATDEEYAAKEARKRRDNHIPPTDPVLFVEVTVTDPTEFTHVLRVKGVTVGTHQVLRIESSTVPNALAALFLHIRDQINRRPHAYFTWSEGHPLYNMIRYALFGEGDTAPVTHEVLRKVEPDPDRRPVIHVGG